MDGTVSNRGRHGKMDMVDGEFMEIRSISKVGGSAAIILPKLWIEMVSAKGELKGVGIDYNENTVTIKPYYGEAI